MISSQSMPTPTFSNDDPRCVPWALPNELEVSQSLAQRLHDDLAVPSAGHQSRATMQHEFDLTTLPEAFRKGHDE